MEIVLVIILFHILGDFYFLSNRLATKKEYSYKSLLLHSFIYQLVFLVLPFLSSDFLILLPMSIFIAFSHFILDTFKFMINKFLYLSDRNKSKLFIIDQLIHVLVFWIYWLLLTPLDIEFDTFIFDFFLVQNFNLMRWITLILLIMKPSNIFFKQIYGSFKPSVTISDENNNAGKAIGNLEWILFVLCLYFNIYTALGLILTAKSIARYDKISREPEFAEYYLLGTLSSILFAVISFMICFVLI